MSFKQFATIAVIVVILLLIGATASADLVKFVVDWVKTFFTELAK